jgi:taurine dioxygenase
MSAVEVTDLSDDLHFGARVTGLTKAMAADPALQAELNAVFEDRGVIVFSGMEPTLETQQAVSNIFGPPKRMPLKTSTTAPDDPYASVLEITREPGAVDNQVVEVGGQRLCNWRPFHFDHAYTKELNRGGVLRCVIMPPAGGLTGFVDGVQLYRDMDPDLRARIEGLYVIYTLNTLFTDMRFGLPRDFRQVVDEAPEFVNSIRAHSDSLPRAMHPAVWTRRDGQKVLHVSGQHSVGVAGHENPEGDALLGAVCQEIIDKAKPYFHDWKPDDMVLWDNWRMLHGVSGIDPSHTRKVQRTTITGDYGLGLWESEFRAPAPEHASAAEPM